MSSFTVGQTVSIRRSGVNGVYVGFGEHGYTRYVYVENGGPDHCVREIWQLPADDVVAVEGVHSPDDIDAMLTQEQTREFVARALQFAHTHAESRSCLYAFGDCEHDIPLGMLRPAAATSHGHAVEIAAIIRNEVHDLVGSETPEGDHAKYAEHIAVWAATAYALAYTALMHGAARTEPETREMVDRQLGFLQIDREHEAS